MKLFWVIFLHINQNAGSYKTVTFETYQHQNIPAKTEETFYSQRITKARAKPKDLLFISYVRTQHEELPTSKSPSKLAHYFGCES